MSLVTARTATGISAGRASRRSGPAPRTPAGSRPQATPAARTPAARAVRTSIAESPIIHVAAGVEPSSATSRSRPPGSGLRAGTSPAPHTRAKREATPRPSRIVRLNGPGLFVSTARSCPSEGVERLRDTVVQAGRLEQPLAVALEEDRQHVVERPVDARVPQRALDQQARAFADEADHHLERDRGRAGRDPLQRRVRGRGEVARGVDERAVEVEDEERHRRASPDRRSRGPSAARGSPGRARSPCGRPAASARCEHRAGRAAAA